MRWAMCRWPHAILVGALLLPLLYALSFLWASSLEFDETDEVIVPMEGLRSLHGRHQPLDAPPCGPHVV